MTTAFETTGVEAHNGKIRIHFNWAEDPDSRPARQRANTGLKDSPENQMRAHFKRLDIIDKIGRNQFSAEDYCKELPHSSFAKKQLKLDGQQERTYEEAVDIYIDCFVEQTDSGVRSPSTREANRKVLTGKPAQILKGMPLQSIRGKDMYTMQCEWEKLRPNGTKIKNKTVNNRIDAFSAMFKHLHTKLEIIKDDPTVALERRPVDRKEPLVFDADMMSDCYKDLYKNEGPDHANLYAIICLLGLRVGEACGISEGDFNLAGSEVTIRRALITDRKKLTEEEQQEFIDRGKVPHKTKGVEYWKNTKTGTERTLECEGVLKEIIREQLLRNQGMPQTTIPVHKFGDIEHETLRPLFWRTVHGKVKLFNSKSAQNAYDRTKKRLGFKTGEIPPIKDGRSTNASVIASTTGNVFKIQAQLGHSDIGTLKKHYAKHFKSHEDLVLDAIFRAARNEVVPPKLTVVEPTEVS